MGIGPDRSDFPVGGSDHRPGPGIALQPEVTRLRTWLGFALGLSLVFVLAEVLTGLLSGEIRTVSEMRLLLVGSPAVVFWFHLLVGLVLPLILLRAGSLLTAGVLALLGVLAEKVWFLAAGQAEPWLALPQGSYFSSWVEFVALVGAVALAALIYLILAPVVRQKI